MNAKKLFTKILVTTCAAAMLVFGGQFIGSGSAAAPVGAVSVYAAQQKVTTANLNMRDKAGTSGKIILTIPKGKTVEIQSQESNGWFKVKYNGKTGYSYGKYLKDASSSGSSAASKKVTTSGLNMRDQANAKTGKVILTIPKGKTVDILKKESNGWYQVKYNGKTGYCNGRYLADPSSLKPSSVPKTTTKTLAEDLKMRSTMSTADNSNLICIIPKGGKVSILSTEKDYWLKASYNGKTGYIRSGHFTDDTSRMGIGATDPYTETMNCDLNMRSSMSKANNKNIILVIPKGGKVTIVAKEADNWFKVQYNGKTGYIKGGHFQ